MNHNKFVNEYRAYVGSIERSLVTLKSDLIHQSEGKQIIYALDFSELFYFLHPFADMNIEKSITPIPGEQKDDALIREQIALSFMINHLGATKILLPPYLVELRDHIRLLRNNVMLSNKNKRAVFEENLVAAILHNTQFPSLKNLVAETKSLKNIGKEGLKEFLEFVKSDFKPLYLALTMSPSEFGALIESISRLFKSEKIKDYFTVFSEDDIQYEELKNKGQKWFECLRQEKSLQKDYARYLDGLACAYIDNITDSLSSKGQRFCFITRSQRMVRVFNSGDRKISSFRKSQKGEFRNLDYVMTYLRFARQSHSEALSEVHRALETIGQIKEGLKYVKAYAGKEDTTFLEKELITLSNSKENLSIALGNKGINIDSELALFLNISDMQRSIFKKIFSVVVENPLLADSLQEESRIVSTTITQQFNYIRLITERDELDRIARWASPRQIESGNIELYPLRSELPVEMSFEDPQIISLVNELIGKKTTTRNLKKWRSTVHSLLNDSSGKPEIVILRSYLFALLDSYDAAFDEIEIGLHKEPPQNILKEMILLKMMFARKTKKTVEGIRAFVENRKIAEKDPRLVREYSVLIWQCVKSNEAAPNNEVMNLVAQLINQQPTVKLAADLVRGILRHQLSDGLKVQALNSLSYYLAEQYHKQKNTQDLEEARIRFDELTKLWPKERWISRFHHTNGWIAYLCAEARIDEIVNLQKAVFSIEEALRDRHAPKGEIFVWREHLKMAKKSLREIQVGWSPQFPQFNSP